MTQGTIEIKLLGESGEKVIRLDTQLNMVDAKKNIASKKQVVEDIAKLNEKLIRYEKEFADSLNLTAQVEYEIGAAAKSLILSKEKLMTLDLRRVKTHVESSLKMNDIIKLKSRLLKLTNELSELAELDSSAGETTEPDTLKDEVVSDDIDNKNKNTVIKELLDKLITEFNRVNQ